MKYPNSWNRLPTHDYRFRYFIETLIELAHRHTPHFYQARLMNIFSFAKEILGYIDNIDLFERSKWYVGESLCELLSAAKLDSFANSFFSKELVHLEKLRKDIQSIPDNRNNYIKLTFILQSIIEKKEKYQHSFQERLCEIIFDHTPTNNEWDVINNLANSYVTLCFSNGISARYVFSRLLMFIRKCNYGDRTAREQFFYITKMIHDSCEFKCTFSLSYKGGQISNLVIADNTLIDKDSISAYSPEFRDLEISIKTLASDYVTAAFCSRNILFEFINNNQFKFSPKINDECLVIRISSVENINRINISEYIEFLTSKAGTIFDKHDFCPEIIAKKLNETAGNYFSRSLRYHFLAQCTHNIEQKFLNLWIALESLFVDCPGNIIGKISENVPLIYASTSLKYRILYLKDILIKNNITIPPKSFLVTKGFSLFDETITDDDFLNLISSEAEAIALFDTLDDMDHLKYRLRKTSELFSRKESIIRQIEKSQKDVKYQLNRIYYFRNLIAHAGYSQGLPLQLISHLLDYLYSTYYALSIAAEMQPHNNRVSLQTLFLTYSVGCDYFNDNINNHTPFPLTNICSLTPANI